VSLKIEFHKITALNYLPKVAFDFLKQGAESETSDLTAEEAILYAKNGIGDIFIITQDDIIYGCVYFMYANGILDIALFGGSRIKEWNDQAIDFIKTLAKSNNCSKIWIASRKGWAKIFPEFEEIGRIYQLNC